MTAPRYRCRACGTEWPESFTWIAESTGDRICHEDGCRGVCDPVPEAVQAKAVSESWFSRHPMGGLEIYPNGETNEPLATFRREDDCCKAIEAHNATHGSGIAPAVVPLLLEALEDLLNFTMQIHKNDGWNPDVVEDFPVWKNARAAQAAAKLSNT